MSASENGHGSDGETNFEELIAKATVKIELESPEKFRASLSQYAYSAKPAKSDDDLKALSLSRRSPRNHPVVAATSNSNFVESDSNSKPKPQKRSNKRILGDIEEKKVVRRSKKQKRGYAAPELYSHLHMLSDYLKDGLDVIFCGINPGYKSAENGHHFYNPTNHFWRCLHRSGLTSKLLHPSEDYTLPDDFNLGLTNLVDRPSAEQAELSKDEMVESVPTLLAKITRFRPRFVCFVGMGIWEVVREGLLQTVSSPLADGNKGIKVKGKKPTSLGLQPYKYVHSRPLVSGTDAITETLFFVVPSTSGRVVRYQLTDKITFFETLKDLKEMKQSDIDTIDMLAIYSQDC